MTGNEDRRDISHSLVLVPNHTIRMNVYVDDSQPFTLERVYRAFNTPNHIHSPSAAAGSEEQLRQNNYMRSSRGFTADSLSFIETVSPQIRRNIIAGRDINLASLLNPYYAG